MYEHRDDIQPSPPDTDVVHRRLRWGLLAAVAVTLVAAIPGIALDSGGDTKKVTSAQGVAPAATTTTTARPGVAAGAPTPLAPAPTTTTGTVTALQTGAAPPAATTTTSVRPAPPTKPCRNSYDPACGPFRWDPDPGPNQPLGVTASAQQVKAGD